jgi:hypothetical protein
VIGDLSGRIAVIGWGSLLWDLDDLAPQVDGHWLTEAGPALPLEFSRISPKRLMSLVVVIDPDHGDPCPSHAIASRRRSVADAAADLAQRERASLDFIGRHDAASGETRASDLRIGALFAQWCAQTGASGAVWTDLPANFRQAAGAPFSVAAGLDYLRGLARPSLAEAKRYIDSAPTQTDTPLRRALAADPWWTGLHP